MNGGKNEITEARLMEENGDRLGAIALLESVLRADPKDHGVRLELAEMSDRAGNWEGAIRYFTVVSEEADEREAMVALRNIFAIFRRIEDWKSAVKAGRKLLERFPDDRESRYHFVHTLGSADMPAEMAEQAFMMCKKDPTDADAFVLMGAAFISLQKYGDARKAFVRALRIDPEVGGASEGLEWLDELETD